MEAGGRGCSGGCGEEVEGRAEMGRGLGGMRDKAICGNGLRPAGNGKKTFYILTSISGYKMQ